MEAHEVDKAWWPFKLAPQLTGKAQQAYAALPPEEAKVYDTFKAVILHRYNTNEDRDVLKMFFWSLEMKTEETLWELVRTLQLAGPGSARLLRSCWTSL